MKAYDCIIIGAGPGGLQAAIYLGRYNRSVIVIDRGGGRTTHAKHIENFLTQKAISGQEIVRLGMEQARSFGVEMIKGTVTKVEKQGSFTVHAAGAVYRAPFVIVSTGATENLPRIENLHRFFGTAIYTCIDCDGYRTTGKRLIMIGNSAKVAHLALAMQELFTRDVTLVLYTDRCSGDYKEILREAGIAYIVGRPKRFLGGARLEGLEMDDGRTLPCEVVMSSFGYKLNDDFLDGLNLERDREKKFVTNRHYEATISGLYIVGPLAGGDQAVVAAGEGALAAIDIKKRLIEMIG